MTITPITAAVAAHLAGEPEADQIVLPAPNPTWARLLHLQMERGLTAEDYAAAEAELGIKKRQIQRQLSKLRQGHPLERAAASFVLTGHHREVIVACDGSVKLAYRELDKAGEELPEYTTFWRAWMREPPTLRAYAKEGAAGLLKNCLYPPFEAPERNVVWQADHFQLPNDVIADGHTTALVKPWLTVFIDDKTRKIMAWHLSAEVGRGSDAEDVCATIAAAIRIRLEDGVEVGGVPTVIRWDNGRSFTAGMVAQMGATIGFECHAVPPYSGHMKGKVERFGGRIQQQFCVLQPGYTHGPKTYKSTDPFRDTPNLTADELRTRLDLWMAEYDRTVHTTTKQTPLERWAADPAPLRRAADEQLRSAFLVAPRTYKVQKKGVHFRNQYWMSSQLMDVVGRKVKVHHPVGTDEFIEIYVDSKWVCTAYPALRLTDAQRGQIEDRRWEAYGEARDLHARAQRIRVGADAVANETDATPSIASMPAQDRLLANPDDLYALLGDMDELEGADAGDADEGAS